VLGPERLETLTIHHGRHTFVSHALAGGRTLAEARDAAGHTNITITSGYLRVAVDDDADVFVRFAPNGRDVLELRRSVGPKWSWKRCSSRIAMTPSRTTEKHHSISGEARLEAKRKSPALR
jgi:hypothetical protein